MEHVLMNFGDNVRIMQDSTGKPVQVGIGEIVRADINPIHAQMIAKGIADETLIICDIEFAKRASKKLGQVMTCLRDLNQENYDELLERFNAINGQNPEELRPTREMVRIALREIARHEVMKLLRNERMAQRVTIHEQGDETTRQEPARNQSGSPRNLPGSTQNQKEPKPAKEPGTKQAAKALKDSPNGQKKPKAQIKRERL